VTAAVTVPMLSRIVILGAAGRDFHNFNDVVYRDDPEEPESA
jgi:predicted GTPase